MPQAFLNRLHEDVDISMDELELLWSRAKEAAKRYKDGEQYYAVVTKIFKNMIGAHFPKQWQKYQKMRSESSAKTNLILHLEGDYTARLYALFKFIETETLQGGGVTINVESNEGKKLEVYLDGDGRDKLTVDEL